MMSSPPAFLPAALLFFFAAMLPPGAGTDRRFRGREHRSFPARFQSNFAEFALQSARRRRSRPGALVVVDVARGAGTRTRRLMRLALAARRTYRTREEAVARFRFLPPAPGAAEDLRERIGASSVREEPDGRFAFKFDPRWFAL